MEKAEVMVFGTRQRLKAQNNENLDIGTGLDGNLVRQAFAFKYLGVVLDVF